jgi:maltose O-acetyltransferase
VLRYRRIGKENVTLSEKEKMLAGELYRSTDVELQVALAQAQQHLRRLNAIPNEDAGQRFAVLQAILGQIGSGTQIKSPFSCDYGLHIRIGSNGFVNYGCVFLDCNLISIGDDAQIGPGVHIYTAFHPVDAEIRRSGLEAAKPVNIGHNVWLGGHCVICPGVTIGDNSVIGAGSVVVRDIPPNRVAVGNPCRIIRQVGE